MILLIITLIIIVIVAIFLITGLTGAPYVPTLKQTLEESLPKLLPKGTTKSDIFIDLGAGDGVVLDVATKISPMRALGVELNPILALIMNFRFRKNPNVKAKCRNFYHYKFPPKTKVLYAFAVGLHIEPLTRKIQREATRLKKPLYFISNAFEPKNLKPLKKSGSLFLYKIDPE